MGWDVLVPPWWGLAQPQRMASACLELDGGDQSAPCPQDVPEQRSMEYPKLYEPGQLNLLFNKREFFICIAQGIYTSVLMFFIPYGVFADATRDDGAQLADYQSFAVTVATSLVIVVSVQVGMQLKGWVKVWVPSCPVAMASSFPSPPDWVGHGLLDSHQPLLHLGQPGRLLRHPLCHAQRRSLPDVPQPVPLRG